MQLKEVTTNTETGEEFDEGARAGRLPCMIGHADLRMININLADGSLVWVEKKRKEVDLASAQKAAERYGLRPEGMFGPDTACEETIAANLLSTARNMFLKDGYHISILFLLRECRPVRIIEMHPEQHGQKYLIMRDVAHDVIKYGADAVIHTVHDLA